jgi:hypothetical protein
LLDTVGIEGLTASFRLKAINAFGTSVDWSPTYTVVVANLPDPVDFISTLIDSTTNVKIYWDMPNANFASIIQFSIVIISSDSQTFFAHPDCPGTDPSTTFCVVSMMSLRKAPFNLKQG